MQAGQGGLAGVQPPGFLQRAAERLFEFLEEGREFLGLVGVGGFQPDIGIRSGNRRIQAVDRSQQRGDAAAAREIAREIETG